MNQLSSLYFSPGALPKPAFRRLKKNALFRRFLRLTHARVVFRTTREHGKCVDRIEFPIDGAHNAHGHLFPDMVHHAVPILNHYAERPLVGHIQQTAAAVRSVGAVWYDIHPDGSINIEQDGLIVVYR